MKPEYYLAHPHEVRVEVLKLERELERELSINLINPFSDINVPDEGTFERDLGAIRVSKGVIGVLPFNDLRTIIEIFYGYVLKKHVYIVTPLNDNWLKQIGIVCKTKTELKAKFKR